MKIIMLLLITLGACDIGPGRVTDACIAIPDASFPELDFRRSVDAVPGEPKGTYYLNEVPVGWAEQEDDPCMFPID